jgi:hypothetical protein
MALKETHFSMQEIWMASRPLVQRNKKKYTRTAKHKHSFQ